MSQFIFHVSVCAICWFRSCSLSHKKKLNCQFTYTFSFHFISFLRWSRILYSLFSSFDLLSLLFGIDYYARKCIACRFVCVLVHSNGRRLFAVYTTNRFAQSFGIKLKLKLAINKIVTQATNSMCKMTILDAT